MSDLVSYERIAEAATSSPCPYAVGDRVTECERRPHGNAKRVEDWDYVPIAIATVTDVSEWPRRLTMDNGIMLCSTWETTMFVRHTRPGDEEAVERRQLGHVLTTLRKDDWERLPIEELRALAVKLVKP